MCGCSFTVFFEFMKGGALALRNGKKVAVRDFDYVIVKPSRVVSSIVKIFFILHLKAERVFSGAEKFKFIIPREWRRMIFEFVADSNTLVPIEGAIEQLLELRRCGYEIIVVTSRTGFLLNLATFWLERNNLGFIEVIGTKNKAKVIDELDCVDIVIDDNHRFIASIIGEGIRCIIFSWPHNKAKYEYIERADSWVELGSSLRR